MPLVMANEKGRVQVENRRFIGTSGCSLKIIVSAVAEVKVFWKKVAKRVRRLFLTSKFLRCVRPFIKESNCLGLQFKMGCKFILRLNISKRPIANKYCEGKVKSNAKA